MNPPSPTELKEGLKNFQLSAVKDQHNRALRLKDADRQVSMLGDPIGVLYDVGAAAGFFMAVAREHGWKVHGNDLSMAAIRWAKKEYNLDITYGFLEDLPLAAEHYDAVVLWNTLEHCIDPMETLRTCNRMMRIGGRLLINVPSKTKEQLSRHYTGGHMTEFTDKSLFYALGRTQFKPDHVFWENQPARQCLVRSVKVCSLPIPMDSAILSS